MEIYKKMNELNELKDFCKTCGIEKVFFREGCKECDRMKEFCNLEEEIEGEKI